MPSTSKTLLKAIALAILGVTSSNAAISDEAINRLVSAYSAQRVIGLNVGESYTFQLRSGPRRVIADGRPRAAGQCHGSYMLDSSFIRPPILVSEIPQQSPWQESLARPENASATRQTREHRKMLALVFFGREYSRASASIGQFSMNGINDASASNAGIAQRPMPFATIMSGAFVRSVVW